VSSSDGACRADDAGTRQQLPETPAAAPSTREVPPMTWVIVFIVLAVLIVGFWIANTVRWTKQNGTLQRKSPPMFRRRRRDG